MKAHRAHLIILLVTVALTTAMRMAFAERHQRERAALQAKGQNARIQELVSGWNRFEYTPLKELKDFRSIAVSGDLMKLQLSSEQREFLPEFFAKLFSYLSEPSLEKYTALKTEGLTFAFTPSEELKNLLKRDGWRPEQIANASMQEVLTSFWRSATQTIGRTRELSSVTALCLRCVAGTLSPYNSVEMIVGGPVRKGKTVIESAIEPGFKYDAFESSSHSATFLHLSIYAQSSISANAGPMYISLGWSEADQRWALTKLFADSTLAAYIPY